MTANTFLENIRKNIPESDIDNSNLLKALFHKSDLPTVFLPNYGEFGSTIFKLIKLVHFYDAPEKIVCCQKGEEGYL